MFQIIRSLKKSTVIVSTFALWSCAAVSQPTPASPAKGSLGAQTEAGKAQTEKIIRQNDGVAAIVFNEKGQPVVVNREGQLVPTCQICTPELERKFGPQCAKAGKASEATGKQGESTLICNKLNNTNVLGVEPISVLRHTGSECMTFFFNNGGQPLIYQFCW
jgi:hypothetical protein